MSKVYRLPPDTCPWCGYKVDAHAGDETVRLAMVTPQYVSIAGQLVYTQAASCVYVKLHKLKYLR